MRLICPNCDAQYDVPDDVMPPEGRDVQCSNCSQTWFQKHPQSAQEPSAPVEPETQTDTDPEPSKPIREDEGNDTLPSAPPAQAEDSPPPAPARKSLDPAVASVLQEEAEYEVRARQKEGAGMVETQPDLGLKDAEERDDLNQNTETAPRAVAKTPPDDTGVAVAAAGTRSSVLPDIEEINSTLRSNNDRSPEGDPGQTAQIEALARRSFGRGFFLMIAIAAIMALIYVQASELKLAMPQAEPWISRYVATVDQWRVSLDGQVERLVAWLNVLAAGD